MISSELRAIQHPIKERYKADPASAMRTFHARAVLGENLTARLDSAGHERVVGPHEAAGGSGKELCSGDMLLESLVACAAVTLSSVATVMEIAFSHAEIRAEGDADFRGTLGVERSVPVGITNIRLIYDLTTDAPDDKVAKLVQLTERYCIVYQTLAAPPKVEITVSRG
ncbi:MAG: OsmC family protein [Bacteroidetes bacterium]|nr:OsmC family protein [Bacteroidota bacterium]